jgi:hypothetical protein
MRMIKLELGFTKIAMHALNIHPVADRILPIPKNPSDLTR